MTMVLLFFAGLALLWFGGEGLVRASAALGIRFGLTPLVVGLTIVAFATSAPELAVSLAAAFRDSPGLAVGNVVGSNICNITLVLGVTALIGRPRLKGQLAPRDSVVLVLATLAIPLLLLIDGQLGRVEGSVLVVAIVTYVTLTVRDAQAGRYPATFAAEASPSAKPDVSILLNVLFGAASLAMLILGSDLFVRAAVEIALALGISSALVGLSAAALGTSLPELATSIVAARRGQPELAAGNLIGSNIFNLLLVLGATSLVRPLVPNGIGPVDLGVMVTTSLVALAVMLVKPRIGGLEGTVLLACYAGYIAWLFSTIG